jgi:uncharacterized OB-fold protein
MQVAKYWREIPKRYRMEAGKCTKCQNISFPQRLVCPECGSKSFEKINLSGKGKVATFTITHVAPEGFGDQVPYAVGIVELDEGIRVMAQITDCELDKLKIGDRVVSKFRRIREEGKTGMIMYGYKFVPDVGL